MISLQAKCPGVTDDGAVIGNLWTAGQNAIEQKAAFRMSADGTHTHTHTHTTHTHTHTQRQQGLVL